jgi:hypothetical protein
MIAKKFVRKVSRILFTVQYASHLDFFVVKNRNISRHSSSNIGHGANEELEFSRGKKENNDPSQRRLS